MQCFVIFHILLCELTKINHNAFTDPCTENAVRLNDDVVEVCHNAQWGLVCAHSNSYFTPAAEVVCRQVGIPSTSQFACGLPDQNVTGPCRYDVYSVDPLALTQDISFYSDSPVILNDISCSGFEVQLFECSRNGYGNFSAICTDIAAAYCEGKKCRLLEV